MTGVTGPWLAPSGLCAAPAAWLWGWCQVLCPIVLLCLSVSIAVASVAGQGPASLRLLHSHLIHLCPLLPVGVHFSNPPQALRIEQAQSPVATAVPHQHVALCEGAAPEGSEFCPSGHGGAGPPGVRAAAESFCTVSPRACSSSSTSRRSSSCTTTSSCPSTRRGTGCWARSPWTLPACTPRARPPAAPTRHPAPPTTRCLPAAPPPGGALLWSRTRRVKAWWGGLDPCPWPCPPEERPRVIRCPSPGPHPRS